MNARPVLLALALAATLAAVWLGEPGSDGDSANVVEAMPRRMAMPSPTPESGISTRHPPAPEAAARFAIGGPDLFPAQSWRPPPAPAPVVVAPVSAPPQAPSLPFKYVGKWDAGEGVTFFLAQGELVHSVRVGQNLAQWRFDSVDAGGMNFTYLPLQQQRQLRFGP